MLVDGEAALAAAQSYAALLATTVGPRALRVTKRQLYDDLLTHDVGAALDDARRLLDEAMTTGGVPGRCRRAARTASASVLILPQSIHHTPDVNSLGNGGERDGPILDRTAHGVVDRPGPGCRPGVGRRRCGATSRPPASTPKTRRCHASSCCSAPPRSWPGCGSRSAGGRRGRRRRRREHRCRRRVGADPHVGASPGSAAWRTPNHRSSPTPPARRSARSR